MLHGLGCDFIAAIACNCRPMTCVQSAVDFMK